ncbi:MAG: radical SAM protein [Myxococcales bacterium]|nr:radical SAM protein [Myxococcales bacterium]
MTRALGDDARQALMDAPRPRRRLPLAGFPSTASGAQGAHEPLAREARAVDASCKPIYAVWELTLKCDLQCRHCGSRAGLARPDELTTREAIELATELAALGVQEVALIGGEVYLHDGFVDVVREIRRLGMQCTVVTGGRGMTEERAARAAAAGVQSVAVSIDGAPTTHDRLRAHRGSFAAAAEALRRCRAAGMQVAGNTQINRLNMNELPQILALLTDVGAHGWQVQLTVPVGRAADEPEVILQPRDLLTLFPLLAELKVRCDAARIKLMPGNNIGYFGPYEGELRHFQPDAHQGSCAAGVLTVGIESNGDIKGCPSLPTDSWVGGNVREHSLRDIWERARALRHMRDRTASERWGYCATCYYGDTCQGGCTWMAAALFGRPGNNPYCHHRVLELARVGQHERVTRDGEAPGLPFDRAKWSLALEKLE